MVDHMTGGVRSGQKICVPYTVQQSKMTWVAKARYTSKPHFLRCILVWGWIFRINQTKTGVSRANTKSEWLALLW